MVESPVLIIVPSVGLPEYVKLDPPLKFASNLSLTLMVAELPPLNCTDAVFT
jgi:hypothetical protein